MFGPDIWRFGRVADTIPGVLRLQREMNRLFADVNQSQRHAYPAINVLLAGEEVIVKAELPGIEPEKTAISLAGDTITLSGVRTQEPLRQNESYHRQERTQGSFVRTLQLPFQVNAEKVEAKYEKGILSIRLSRAEEDKPKKITIKCE